MTPKPCTRWAGLRTTPDESARTSGDAHCPACTRRPAAVGGTGSCPMAGTIYDGRHALVRHNCSAFVQGGRPSW